jgi:hypothetical protein
MNGPDRPMPPSEDLPEPEPELRDLAVLARILQVALVVAFVLALGGAFVPGRVGDVSEVALLVVLIGAPVLRVAWLTVDWARERDRVFVGLGLVLLAVLAASGLIKFL